MPRRRTSTRSQRLDHESVWLDLQCPEGHPVGRARFSFAWGAVALAPRSADWKLEADETGTHMCWVCRTCVREGLRDAPRGGRIRTQRLARLAAELDARGMNQQDVRLTPDAIEERLDGLSRWQHWKNPLAVVSVEADAERRYAMMDRAITAGVLLGVPFQPAGRGPSSDTWPGWTDATV